MNNETNNFQNFIGISSLQKTLRNALIPTETTQQFIVKNGIIKEDELRGENRQILKDIMDDYYRGFISETLSSIDDIDWTSLFEKMEIQLKNGDNKDTLIKEQAERWARRYNSKIVSIYDVRLNSDLKIKDFREMSEEWLDFIVDCRSGKAHDYDIVIGAMADDQIYNFISDFMDGVITRKQFWVLAQFKYPTHQINFCSEAALKCLEYRGYEVVE